MTRKDVHTGNESRQLSGAERMRLMFPNANVVMMARIGGQFSEDALRTAISKVRERHALLGMRVRLDESQQGWFTSEGVPPIPVTVIPRSHPEMWKDVAIEQHRQPFFYGTGPLIRFALLTSDETSDLIITAHHAICDGLSLAYLVRDLLQHLADPDRPVAGLPIPLLIDESIMPVSVSKNLVSRMMLKLLNRNWERREITFDAADFRDLHRAFWEEHEGHILAWALTEAQTSELVARCRAEEVTVNTALTTAFVIAQNEVEAAHERLDRVVISVDFRERLTRPVGEAFAFYASAVRPRLEYERGTPFWSAARAFHAQIRQLLTDENIFESQQLSAFSPSLLDALFFAKQGKLDDKLANRMVERMGIGEVNTSLVVTNLGRLGFSADYGPLSLEALYGPYVYSDTIEKYLGVITVNGRMHLTLCSGSTIIDNEMVEAVRDAAMDHLGSAVGW